MIQYLIDAGRSPAAEAMFGCRCCLVLATAQPPAERRKRAIVTWSSYFFPAEGKWFSGAKSKKESNITMNKYTHVLIHF